MALIGALRDKMGTWVVVFVFVAILSFILGDLFSGNSNILNWNRRSVGEIAGKEISVDEYQNVIQERVGSYYLSNGQEPSEREMTGIREQAWDLLIARHAIVPEFEKVGIEVTDKEIEDMISGKNINEGIKQSFVNQETQQFDRALLGNYLNQLKTMPTTSEQYIRWQLFQKELKPSRERIKYENLLIKTSYVTAAEAELEYHSQNDVAEAKLLFIPYFAISDSVTNVSDEQLREYYNKNKERFNTKASRDIKYITIPVVPSAEDSLAVKEALTDAVNQFKTSQDDSLYAVNNTEGNSPFSKYNPGTLPAFITSEQLVEGNVIGPFLEGETYKVAKISKIFTDTAYAAKASHILIRATDATETSKAEAREKARGILKEIKAGASFAAKASEHGTDGTKTRGGDLGWFSSGQMVKPFETAVFSASKPGLLNDVVETEFGFHIINVTEVKTNRAYKIAMIEQQIVPSDASLNEAFRKAEAFASGISGVADFEARAKEQGLTIQEAKNVTPADRRIGTLGEARQVVQWLFRDASVGEVSEVFDLTEQYAVAIMTNEIKEGFKPLELVKDEITPEVKKEAKAKIIIEKLKAGKGTTLEEIAQSFGNDASVNSSSDIKLSTTSLPTIGYDPKVVGAVFSLENGKRSEPTAGENGVVILETQNKTVAPAINNYTSYKDQLLNNSYNLNSMGISEAIREKAEIADNRYKFF
jgi:peptidyl-prolyl cis-trans isomerase D